MIKILRCMIVLVLASGCTEQKSEKQVQSNDTLMIPETQGRQEDNESNATPPDMSIEGQWSDGDPTPAFIITADSIFHQKDHSSARYSKEGEWAIFYYPDEEVHIRAYKIHPDTLVFESVSTQTKYWKLKEQQLQ